MASPRFSYAPAPESRAVVNLKPSYGLFIDGEFVEPLDGDHFKTESPASQEVLAEVSMAGRLTSTGPSRPPGGHTKMSGRPCPVRNGPSTSSGWPA